MKKILSLSLSIFVLVLIALSLSSTRVDAFAGGDGSPENPYQISTCLELQDMDTDLDANYILINNIDCSATTGWNAGAGFEPVGNSGTPFVGTLDGQGFNITELFTEGSAFYVGLFGVVGVGGEIDNVGLEDAQIGIAFPDEIFVGALVGKNDGTITRSHSTGLVDVNVDGPTGGLVGSNTGSITNSYSRANVTNNDSRTAGLVGSNTGTITKSYSVGAVSGPISGGLVSFNSGTITNSFWDTQTSGQATSAGGTGKTTAEMKDEATFTDTDTPGLTSAWDFVDNPNDDGGSDNFWDIDGLTNNGYPFLNFVEATVPDEPIGLSATAIGMTQVDLSWSAPAEDGDVPITGYMIEQKIGAGAFATLIADTATTSTTYSDTGLTAGTLYTYRVSAVNDIGTGDSSDEAFATTEAEPVVEEEEDEGGPSSHRRSGETGVGFSSEETSIDSVATKLKTLQSKLISLLTQLLEELKRLHAQTL